MGLVRAAEPRNTATDDAHDAMVRLDGLYTCSDKPGRLETPGQFMAKGRQNIVCISLNFSPSNLMWRMAFPLVTFGCGGARSAPRNPPLNCTARSTRGTSLLRSLDVLLIYLASATCASMTHDLLISENGRPIFCPGSYCNSCSNVVDALPAG